MLLIIFCSDKLTQPWCFVTEHRFRRLEFSQLIEQVISHSLSSLLERLTSHYKQLTGEAISRRSQSILIWKHNLWQARWNLFRIFADMWALYSSFLAESPQETKAQLWATNKNGQSTFNKLICVRKVLWSHGYILTKKKNNCITQVRPRLPPGRVRPLK